MKIFMISGKARSGKDTFGDALESVLTSRDYKVCRLSVGIYIKFYAQRYFGWDGKEETKPRELLQMLGTEVIRKQIDPKFHVNRLIEDIKVLSNFFDVFIISDVREPLEIEEVKKNYGCVTTIKMIRPDFLNELTSEQRKHYTEVAMDNYNDYDYEVINDKDIDSLNLVATRIIDEVMKNES